MKNEAQFLKVSRFAQNDRCKNKEVLKMSKRSWWLDIQLAGAVGFAARCIPILLPLSRKPEWYVSGEDSKLPPVSVIVPARNEAKNIERCVTSILAEDYPDFELIVVDDGSTDATPNILARLAEHDTRLKVVRLDGKLPEGWSGKVHAMYNGVQSVRPESTWLLFSDADTKHSSFALKRAVAASLHNNLDLFSVLSKIEMQSFWEKVLMPIVVLGITLQYPLEQVNSPKSKLAIANGQFLLIKRTAYEKVGGWEGNLRNSILDDRDMGLAVKRSGGKIRIEDGREIVSVRMYTNFEEIWKGWRKNAFVGSRSAFITFPIFIITSIFMGIFPFFQLPYALIKWLTLLGAKGEQKKQECKRTGKLLLFSGISVGLNVFVRSRLDKGLGVSNKYSLLNPLGIVVIIGILLDSMWRSITGKGLSWKGRDYQDVTKTQQML
jgi:chlorobactene glucosyltransferase